MVASVYFVGSADPAEGNLSAPNATCTPGDVLVLLAMSNTTEAAYQISSVTGLGATWTKIPGASADLLSAWVGVNPTMSTGEIVGSSSVSSPGVKRAFRAYGIKGSTATASGYPRVLPAGGTATTASASVGLGQAVFGMGFSDSTATALSSTTPASGWSTKNTVPITTGRWVGDQYRAIQSAESVNVSSYRAGAYTAALMVVVGDAGMEPTPTPDPEPDPEQPAPVVSVWENGARVGLDTTSVMTNGVRETVTLAGIYETRSAINHFDPAPVLAGIDSATNIAELESALIPLMEHSVATVNIAETSHSQGSYTAYPVSFTDPRLKPFLRYMVESLSRIKSGVITGGQSIDVVVCGTLSAASGVAFSSTMDTFVAVNQSQTHYDTVGPEDERAHPALFMHELAHLIEYGSTDEYLQAHSAMVTGLEGANPPGFTYGSAAADQPFEGEHPLGFPRFYGRTSRVEDFADMVSFMTVPALYVDLQRWMQSDPYLVKKHQVVKGFLAAIGWGQYAIENMHGHLPLVHQL